MGTKNLPARAGAQLPANWEKEMAAHAQQYAEAEAATGGGAWLSIRAGQLSFQGTPLPDSQLECVVLDYRFENTWYGGVPFDADNPRPPHCFAIAKVEGDLAPHQDSHDPQHQQCKGCVQNEFGTSDRGKGKACKNIRRLALLHSDYLKSPQTIADAPVVFLKVPPTSLTGWANYVKKISNVLGKPPYAVVTRVTVSPDQKVQVRVDFDVASEIRDKKLLGAIFAKRGDAQGNLDLPYQWTDPEEKKPRRRAEKKTPRPALNKAPKKASPLSKLSAPAPKRSARAAAPAPAKGAGFGKF
jgi:hypothetical protein